MKILRIFKYVFMGLTLGMIIALLIIRQFDIGLASGVPMGSITPLMFDFLKYPICVCALAWITLQIIYSVLKRKYKKEHPKEKGKTRRAK